RPEIVAVEGDVEGADRKRGAVDLGDLRGEPVRQAHPARAQPDERQVFGAAVLLEDLVRDASEGPVERGLVENLRFLPVAWCGCGAHLLSLRASRGSLKGKHPKRPSSLYMARSLGVNGPRRRRSASARRSAARARP